MITFSIFWIGILCYSLLANIVVFALTRDSAWNGQVSPSAARVTSFTPYYVPPGAKAYSSSSPLMQYSGIWYTAYSASYVNCTSRWTHEVNASITFSFDGTGIECFGTTGDGNGLSKVYIDHHFEKSINSWSRLTLPQQRIFWRFGLHPGKHTITIVNGGRNLNIDACVVTRGPNTQGWSPLVPTLGRSKRGKTNLPPPHSGRETISDGRTWGLVQKGTTGVHAMQLTIVSPTHALVIDKVEHNPLTIDGHPAWASLYNLETHALRPLRMRSNSFCAGGSFIGNGTLVNVGGNPVVEDHTSAADFGDIDGLQAIRLMDPCDVESENNCNIHEDPARIRLASPRWYNTVVRISDGSAMIIGGSKKGGWINNATVNNPTIEYYPPKNIHGVNGLPIELEFLSRTLNSNLFPIAFSLPDGTLFIAANQDAIIYDWKSNTERPLPRIPNGVRVTYPMTASAVLLPLRYEDNYTPEILICGGSSIDDRRPSYQMSSQDPASSQCSRMILSDEGIKAGWQVEQMPEGRVMPDIVILPTGKLIIVNGAGSGISGYGNVQHQVGRSNADNPRLTSLLYDPQAKHGQRFSSEGMPTSNIPRLYHSVATLAPDGSVMIAGSNPNLDRSEMPYGTEYRVEWLISPYMRGTRPEIRGEHPKQLGFSQSILLRVEGLTGPRSIEVVLIDLGYVTHSVHANSRLVYLRNRLTPDGDLEVDGPPNEGVYPPGPGWLSVVIDGIPSKLIKIMVGEGHGPPVDELAIENALKNTRQDQKD